MARHVVDQIRYNSSEIPKYADRMDEQVEKINLQLANEGPHHITLHLGGSSHTIALYIDRLHITEWANGTIVAAVAYGSSMTEGERIDLELTQNMIDRLARQIIP